MLDRSLPHILPYQSYFSTAYDLWVGKFIGGTFGAPFEGYKSLLDIDVRDLLPLKIVENDDTDLQLLWLHALQERGIELTSTDLVQEWREHVKVPWNEYGIAMANWERGIMPPRSGSVDNWFFGNGMGCPIRSEIWAIICPGLPDRAAAYARQDAEIDHTEDSIQAEVFLAALESALFLEKDLGKAIEVGMRQVDPSTRFFDLVTAILEWAPTRSWQELRRLVLRSFGHPDFTNCLQNIGFILIALLKGDRDFISTMNIAIRCGYDTDCTAATAGAILNALNGSDSLPSEIKAALNDHYQVSDWMRGFPSSGSLVDLTHASCRIGLQIVERERAAGNASVAIIDDQNAPKPPPLSVKRQPIAALDPVANPFPEWLVLGPFFRDWPEISPQNERYPDHGNTSLPSVQYMTHNHSGFDSGVIDLAALSSLGTESLTATAEKRLIRSQDSRLLIEDDNPIGPCTYYAYAVFESPDDSLNWLLAGSAGPIEIWLNGAKLVESSSFQPLTPCTFDTEARLRAGTNHIALKLERASQPIQAAILFKRHEGKHWHQCFINTSLNWLPRLEAVAAAPHTC